MAQGSPDTESLYDFVYLDRDRLASLSAQIFDHGTLVGIKTEDRTQDHIASEMMAGIKPLFSAAEKEQQANVRGVERQFDAGWSLPLNVLHRLDELSHIKRSLSAADFGDLVLMSGNMNLIDVGIMKSLWEPLIEMERMSTAASAKTAAKQREAMQARQVSKQLAAIMQALPHSIQLRLFNAAEQAWASLRREYLTVNPEDFSLKHGPAIQGVWHCLAVLDGKPERDDEDFNFPDEASDIEQSMWQLSLQLRLLFGRRAQDYGLTPIAIFRASHPFVPTTLPQEPASG